MRFLTTEASFHQYSIVLSFMNFIIRFPNISAINIAISVKIAAIGVNISIFCINRVIILGTRPTDIIMLAVTAGPRCRGSWLLVEWAHMYFQAHDWAHTYFHARNRGVLPTKSEACR